MDYFSTGRRRGNSVNSRGGSVNSDGRNPPTPSGPPPSSGVRRRPVPGGSLEGLRQPSSIRIRRLPTDVGTQRPASQQATGQTTSSVDFQQTGRRRSTSEPQHFGTHLAPPGAQQGDQRTGDGAPMTTLTEAEEPGQQRPQGPRTEQSQYFEAMETPPAEDYAATEGAPSSRVLSAAPAMHSAGNAARANRGLLRTHTTTTRHEYPQEDEYESEVVDLLDLVDPEVRTLGTLTNVQNSLFVPDLGRLVNRRPTYNLSSRPSSAANVERIGRARAATNAAKAPGLETIPQGPPAAKAEGSGAGDIELQPQRNRRFSISSDLSDSRYAVLPHGITLDDWSEEDKQELDDHVRHLMHSRKEGFKRSWKGFKQYISKPLGLFVFIYAVLITLFGATWVFFLIGWISAGQRQGYYTNVVDLLLVAMFALIGDGLAPFRMVDTYHMCFIAHYHHLTWKLRQKRNLPELVDHNDLPIRRLSAAQLEDAIDKEETQEFSVLTPLQQRRLQYHQAKFSKSHTFYRPHETATHHAFPLNLLVATVVLLDCHSMFQVALGTCTWSINYHHRPQALTATILACSISCNITSGILISVGDHRTRKKDVIERIERQNLTQEALERMARTRKSEDAIANTAAEVNQAVAQRDQHHAAIEEQTVGPQLIDQAVRPDLVEQTPMSTVNSKKEV